MSGWRQWLEPSNRERLTNSVSTGADAGLESFLDGCQDDEESGRNSNKRMTGSSWRKVEKLCQAWKAMGAGRRERKKREKK